ncbi:hypothetical protein LZF95_09840 [Algoriphagus sp. AGSA1]|uniref:hypothetical protein n=1 Tax=Algoriphagus sp. AGSA1 TaxID=2907213 RepID=UPI001F15C3EF|nr:hypothetical protein [Algoriphagus sp. AGSA1]MCE7054974.1 hypothetical protein [Algoriphagus sp. AGSA1]
MLTKTIAALSNYFLADWHFWLQAVLSGGGSAIYFIDLKYIVTTPLTLLVVTGQDL